MATDMKKLHGGKALGRARMDLYAAVNRRDSEQIALLVEVCHELMEDT